MELHQINRFFTKYGIFIINWRWPLLLFIIAFTLFALFGLGKAQTKVSEESFFSQEDKISQQDKSFKQQFGNNDQIAVLVTSNDVFKPEVLKAIQEIGNELLKNVPFADKVTSLTSIEIPIGNEAEISVVNPIANGIPKTPKEIEKLRHLVLSRKNLVGQIISPDSKETWIVLSLRSFPDEDKWSANNEEHPFFQVGEAAIKVLTDPKWHSDAFVIKPVGMPYIKTEERNVMDREMSLRIGIGFLLMVLLLGYFLRSWRGVIVPIFSTIFGVTVVFGMMGWLGFPIDQSMILLPVFLGMALSVSYSVHIVNAIKKGLSLGLVRKQAIIEAVSETGWPIAFTALTTMGSMLSFLSAGIVLTDWLAWVTVSVVFSVYMYVTLLLPILLSFGNNSKKYQNNLSARRSLDFSRFAIFVIQYRRILLFVTGVLVVALLPALTHITVNMSEQEMMGTKLPYLKRIEEVTSSQLGSYVNYNIQLDYDKAGAIKDPKILKNWQRLLDEVGHFSLTKKNINGAKVQSINNIIRDMNQTLHSDDPKYYRIPNNRDLIAQLLLLYEISGGKQLYQWVDDNYRSTRAQVEMSTFSANEVVDELAYIKKRSKELFPNGHVTLVGMAVKFAEINKRLVSAELISFFSALFVIALLLMLVFSSIKTGLIGLIPNLAPIVAIGGVMGYGGFSLDMITMTVMPMMLGIAVDDSIHFITRIKLAFEECGRYQEAIIIAFSSVAKNLVVTTVILSAAFGVLITSPLNMMNRLGLLTVIGLLAALLADLLLTPILIYITRPFGQELSSKE